jgi:hypothetical protein
MSAEFKKPKRANIRKKSKDEDDSEGDDQDDVRARLEETKREQKFRSRGPGVDTDTLRTGKRLGESTSDTEEVVEEKESLLNSQFSTEQKGQATYTVMEQVSATLCFSLAQASPMHLHPNFPA